MVCNTTLGLYVMLYVQVDPLIHPLLADIVLSAADDVDVFGNTKQDLKKPNLTCRCPKCSVTIGVPKFAPHLEKCMGLGRNRLASKRPQRILDSESGGSDSEGEEYVPDKKGNTGVDCTHT